MRRESSFFSIRVTMKQIAVRSAPKIKEGEGDRTGRGTHPSSVCSFSMPLLQDPSCLGSSHAPSDDYTSPDTYTRASFDGGGVGSAKGQHIISCLGVSVLHRAERARSSRSRTRRSFPLSSRAHVYVGSPRRERSWSL